MVEHRKGVKKNKKEKMGGGEQRKDNKEHGNK